MDRSEKKLPNVPLTVKGLALEMFYYTSTAILAPLLILVSLGFFLDKYFQTKPWLMLISILLAFIITNILIFKRIRKLTKKIKKISPEEETKNEKDNNPKI